MVTDRFKETCVKRIGLVLLFAMVLMGFAGCSLEQYTWQLGERVLLGRTERVLLLEELDQQAQEDSQTATGDGQEDVSGGDTETALWELWRARSNCLKTVSMRDWMRR